MTKSYKYKEHNKYKDSMMESLQKRKTEPSKINSLIEQKRKLNIDFQKIIDEINIVDREIKNNCPHLLKYQELKVDYYDDEFGNIGKNYYSFICNRCNQILYKEEDR